MIEKYGAIVGLSFAAMYNAVNGDGYFLKENGEPLHLEQEFWTAASREEFDEQYGSSVSMYGNAFSAQSFQTVIKK